MSVPPAAWRHKPSDTLCTFDGTDRDARGHPVAVMVTPDGVRAQIDPLELLRVDGDWEKVERVPEGGAA